MKYLSKLKDCASLKIILNKYKSKNKTIVFTNGCFDILHPGHIKVLREAKKRGDILVVAINSDTSIKKIKDKKRPILNEKARKEIISSIEFVDYVTIFNEPTPLNLIKKLRPHIIVKGGDWKVEDIVGRNIVKKIVRIKPIKKYSTTSIIKKIIGLYNEEQEKTTKNARC